jgi:hypothetical protein
MLKIRTDFTHADGAAIDVWVGETFLSDEGETERRLGSAKPLDKDKLKAFIAGAKKMELTPKSGALTRRLDLGTSLRGQITDFARRLANISRRLKA